MCHPNLKANKGEKKPRFWFLEHRADAYIAAQGRTLEEAFENAALATFEVMTETDKVKPEYEESVEVEGFDKKALLYNWLEALLVKFELTQNLYREFKIQDIEKIPSGLRLKATIYGERFDPKKHPQKVGVKAVTYHQMMIVQKPDEVIVKFILDI
ncbi:archease [Candidatus Bathyarchaeota archaeon]|nr:MAG: archease [Candidatus Bathyarchaeota archaeon]